MLNEMTDEAARGIFLKRVLRDHAEELFEVFVKSDDGLEGSECGCCADKRALLQKINSEVDRYMAL